MNRTIDVYHDQIGEKLDELADLSENWKRNREKGRDAGAIRAAMIMLAQEVVAIVGTHSGGPTGVMDCAAVQS